LVVLVDYWRVNAFKKTDYEVPNNIPPAVSQNQDIINHEERVNTSAPDDYLLTARNLFKTYASGTKTQAVCGVTFGVKPGETLGLLGPNGAGKSTTFSMLAMQETKSFGKITLQGTDTEQANLQESSFRAALCP